MKLENYSAGGCRGVAAVVDGTAYDLASWAEEAGAAELSAVGPLTVDAIIGRGLLGSLADREDDIARRGRALDGDVRRLSPVINPEKILLAAVNYQEHGKEVRSRPPPEPYFFSKFRNALIGDGDPIYVPRSSAKVDWEVELAAIIGRRCKYAGRAEALGCIAGYAVAVDVSFRDLQFPPYKSPYGPNWVMGKALDNSMPLGPWLVTSDELDDPAGVELRLYVNGQLKQRGSTADMIFGVGDLVAYLSNGMTLVPGDVISTGTPPGVGMSTDGPYLKPGDVVAAEASGIGRITNPVMADPWAGAGSS